MEIIECKTVNHLIDHYLIRKIVFIDEQLVSYEEEFDLLEKERTPFVVYLDSQPIGAARINFKQDYTKLERICILKEYRSKGIGAILMNYLFDYCKVKGTTELFITAQVQALGFYEKLGFIRFGEQFLEANIPHYKMKKSI